MFLADLSLVETLLGEDTAIRNAGVLRDLTDAEMIIKQDLGAAFLLHHVMAHLRAPTNYGLFVVRPPRQGENPLTGEAVAGCYR